MSVSSPVFYDISGWSRNTPVDRIPKLVCVDSGTSGDPQLKNGDQYSDTETRWDVGTSDLGRDLTDSSFLFDRGNPAKVGEHGSTDLLYAEGTPIVDDGTTNLAFEQGSGLAGTGGYDYNGRVEDESDFDFDDCNAHWDESPLAGQGYIFLTIEHRDSSNSHEWWIGTSETDGYNIGKHGGDADGNEFTIIWEGRMYEDGTVTDRDGNELGSWA